MMITSAATSATTFCPTPKTTRRIDSPDGPAMTSGN